jgi:hypothetical protein
LASVARTRATALRVKAKATEEIFDRGWFRARSAVGVRAKAVSLIIGWLEVAPGEEVVVPEGESPEPPPAEETLPALVLFFLLFFALSLFRMKLFFFAQFLFCMQLFFFM